jgi:hypothetical protein
MKTYLVTITTDNGIHQYTVDATEELLAIQASVSRMNKTDTGKIDDITVIRYL